MKKVLLETVLHVINHCLCENDTEANAGNIKKISETQVNDNLLRLGVDSILFIKIVVGLEEAFECEIPDSKIIITEMNTVQKIINVLQAVYDEVVL